MNDDKNNFDPNLTKPASPLTAELETRVIAWVAGEASPAEAEELAKLEAASPDVAAFKRQIAVVHGLVTDATRAEEEPLKLSAERRAALLRTIGATHAPEAVRPLGERIATLPQRRSYWSWRAPQLYFVMSGMAAACLVGLLLYRQRMPELYEAKATLQFQKQNSIMTVQGVVDQEDRRRVDITANEKARESKAEMTSQFMLIGPAPKSAPAIQITEAGTLNLRGSLAPTIPVPEPVAAAAPPPPMLLELTRQKSLASDDLVAAKASVGGAAGRVLSDSNGLVLSSNGPAPAPSQTVASGGTLTFNFGANTPPGTAAPVISGAGAATVSGTARIGGEASKLEAGGVTLGAAASTRTDADSAAKKTDVATTLDAKESQVTPADKNDVVTLSAFTVAQPVGAKDKAAAAQQPAASGYMANAVTTATDAEISTAQQPISTFSLHVSDVSFRLATAAVAALARGEHITEPKIRAEEFYNAFDYGDPAPTPAEKVAARIEQSAHPFLQQRNFVRVAMKVASTGRGAGQPLRLTVLLDTSGSMEREDRVAAVRRAMAVLVSLLGPNDRLTLIGFARQPRLLAEDVPGDKAAAVLDAIARVPAEGGTNIEEALKLGGELARRHLTPGAQNRIVVLTDGAVNLGDAEPARLTAAVEALRNAGIAFDACGVGLEGAGDTVLEALTRKGNGRYYALDSAETADAAFARQLAGAFRPAAENVKLQVRVNPARVGHYRLIGFDEHRLRTEDFRNDQVDAAELAAEEAAVALYQIEVLPQGAGELGEVFVRFRDAATGQMVERSWSIPYEPSAPAFARATPSLQLAGVSALLAEKFLETPVASQFKLGDLAGTVNALRGHYPQQPRVQELVTMFGQVRQLIHE